MLLRHEVVGRADETGAEEVEIRSLGVYDTYPQAQHVVDYLADHDFPVQNVAIVGTELKSIERVTGRLTRGKVALAGARKDDSTRLARKDPSA